MKYLRYNQNWTEYIDYQILKSLIFFELNDIRFSLHFFIQKKVKIYLRK